MIMLVCWGGYESGVRQVRSCRSAVRGMKSWVCAAGPHCGFGTHPGGNLVCTPKYVAALVRPAMLPATYVMVACVSDLYVFCVGWLVVTLARHVHRHATGEQPWIRPEGPQGVYAPHSLWPAPRGPAVYCGACLGFGMFFGSVFGVW
jgi:hypothetical protein